MQPCSYPDLRLPAFRVVINKLLFLVSHSVCRILLQEPERTNTIIISNALSDLFTPPQSSLPTLSSFFPGLDWQYCTQAHHFTVYQVLARLFIILSR